MIQSIVRIGICLLIAAPSVQADPVFKPMAGQFPEHTYSGDWLHFVGGGVAVFDCNGDDYPDLFAAGGVGQSTLLINQAGASFAQADAPDLSAVVGAYPVDINGDSLLDLFVLRVGPNVVLEGKGDCAFHDSTDAFGIDPGDDWSTSFTAWWEPGDARPTLAVGNYVDRKDESGPFEACADHQILHPEDQGYRLEVLGPGFCTLSMLAARDARGKPTLRISNDRHYYVRNGYEQMYDLSERRFLTADDGWQKVSLWGMGIASRDLTGDGRDEVMLTSMGDQLLQIAQDDGTYAPAPYAQNTYAHTPFVGDDGRPSTGWHAEFGDVDNDGLSDLFIAKGNVDQMPGNAMRDPNNLLVQNKDGTFRETADVAGVASMALSRGAALADLDLNGTLDLVVVNRRAPMEIYRNVTPETGNWIAVAPQTADGNTRLIGGSIAIKTADGEQMQQITVGGGHAGGSALPLHFGLGMASEVRVSVARPDGSNCFDALVQANQIIRPSC